MIFAAMLLRWPKYLNPSDFATLASMVLLAGLIFSPFLLSIGMWLLAVAAVWHQFMNTAFERWTNMVPMPRLFWFTCVRIWRNYTAQPIFWILALLFIIPALSGIWSDDHRFWLTNTRVRIPFVTLPLTFANLPSFNSRQLRWIGQFFIILMSLTCLGVGIYARTHQAEVMELIRVGKPIPVPRSHIRFSLSVAMAVLLIVFRLRQISRTTPPQLPHHDATSHITTAEASFSATRDTDTDNTTTTGNSWPEKILGSIAVLFLFGFMHFLAVRSGIIAMYAGLAVFFLHLAITQRRWVSLLVLVLALSISGYTAIRLVPSLALKLSYMRWDFGQYQSGTGGSYSDSGRLASLEAGWELVKENMLIGVGVGDLQKEVETKTLSVHPEFVGQVKLPHNQWLFIWASTGLLGLLASLWAVHRWLGVKVLRNNALFFGFQAIALVSLLVEYTFETSIGAAFYLFNYCFLVHTMRRDF
jgi:O-antigen ligase